MIDSPIVKPFGKKAWNWIMRPPEKDKRYTVLEGAVRSSKTFAVDAKMIVQYTRYKVGGKRVICGTSKATVHRNILMDLEAIAGPGNYAYNMSTGQLNLFGDTYFVLASRDEASYKALLGSTVGLAIVDEAVEAPKSFFAQLLMRMSPDGARLVCTTNPGSPYSSFKTDFLDAPAIQKDLDDLHFTLDDNPNISPEAKAAIIASQTGVYKLRYVDGLWVLATGSIYKDAWDDKLNTCIDATQPNVLNPAPRGQQRYTVGYIDKWYSVDPGVDHPQATYEFHDTGDVVYVTNEDVWDSRVTNKQLTDGQYADALEKFMGGRQFQVILPPEAASYRAELVSRGFSNMDTDSEFMQRARQIVSKTLEESNSEEKTDWGVLKEKIRTDLKRYINKETQKRPLIMPVILEI